MDFQKDSLVFYMKSLGNLFGNPNSLILKFGLKAGLRPEKSKRKIWFVSLYGNATAIRDGSLHYLTGSNLILIKQHERIILKLILESFLYNRCQALYRKWRKNIIIQHKLLCDKSFIIFINKVKFCWLIYFEDSLTFIKFIFYNFIFFAT